MRIALLAVGSLAVWATAGFGQEGPPGNGEAPWERRKRETQDRLGGMPERILRQQKVGKVAVPTLDEALERAWKAAHDAAQPLIDRTFHKGRRLVVPDAHATIQAAIDAARSGDVVLVRPGTYFELLVMKDGVKLTSDPASGGDEPTAVAGARLKLPRRALVTIVDGSKAKPSRHGMVDFGAGVGRKTIVDGFTFRNLPRQDHHVPGHAHGLNVRGASPVIMNCLLLDNGSTGIGNHVIYRDQSVPLAGRDFRWKNVAHRAEAVIYHNVIRGSFGLGIGCNHFSAPHILGNEVFANDDSKLDAPTTPGIGAKHGAAPIIIGNYVHDNPGGGILSRVGAPQGAHPVDRPTRPTVESNVVARNGKEKPAISNAGGGSTETPVRFFGNVVFDSGAVGVGLSEGAVGTVESNVVIGAAAPGISVDGATALRVNGNAVKGARGAGFVIVNGSRVLEMTGNLADANGGPRFVLRDSTVGTKEPE